MINIAKIGKELMIQEPFYGLFLLNLNKVFTKFIPTAAVGLNGINTMLYINEEFFEGLTEKERLAVLKHELLHLCMNHILMGKDFANQNLFNIAADIEINQLIKNLPKECLTLTTFDGITLPPKAGTKKYYELLQNNLNGKNPNFKLKGMVEGINIHITWEEFDQLSEEEKQLVKQQIDHTLKETANQVNKMAGKIPGELSGLIDELFKINPPIFNWKAYFRRFLGFSNEAFIKKTLRKESKRFPQTAGIKVKFKQNILVAIDTSGSVSDGELCEFFSEINHIYKAGVGVTILEFDCALQRVYSYKGKWDGTISGRGGTCFSIPIEYYNENKMKYTSAIIFTDGYAPINGLNPHNKLMWVITSNGQEQKYPGYYIKIPKK